MSSLYNRVRRLEGNFPGSDAPVWAELLDDGSAILRYQDGRRVPAQESDIPRGTKIYKGWSPDCWKVTNEQSTEPN